MDDQLKALTVRAMKAAKAYINAPDGSAQEMAAQREFLDALDKITQEVEIEPPGPNGPIV